MKNILIVEGNLREENQSFSKVGIQTHTESLKDSLAYFTNELKFDVVNPSSDQNIQLISDKLEIACNNNQSIKILEIQRQGKKSQKIGEFMLGSQIKKGSIISNV